ncbi:MAG: creatininase family protein [Pseudomonadota bacterium]|jgi:creatinine amidohydrolase|nr:creatininase family protein [Pseudomonadota bacterium]
MTEVEWRNLTAEQLRERAAQGALAILPVASTEQHGPHLATGVDDVLCSEVCRRAGRMLARRGVPVVVAPTLWAGLAEHHVAFGGSFTLTLPTYHALLRDLCRSILRAGFPRIVIVNGHGGNMSALNALTVDLTRELDASIATTTYFLLAEEDFAAILEDQSAVLHACEAETSMMMAVRPDLVHVERLPEAFGPPMKDARSVLSPPIHRWHSFQEITPTGVIGDARRANADKGERLTEAAAAGLADRLAAGVPWA